MALPITHNPIEAGIERPTPTFWPAIIIIAFVQRFYYIPRQSIKTYAPSDAPMML
jgi:hypothetical protein